MSYYILRKKGVVVNVISDDFSAPGNINKMMLEQTIDEIKQVNDFDDLKDALFPEGVDAPKSEGGFQEYIQKLTKSAEQWVNDFCDKLENVKDTEGKRARNAGQTLLQEMRSLHEKTKAKKKRPKGNK